MSQVKIMRKEIEKMLKDQLECKKVIWDKNGNCTVEIDFDDLKKEKEVTIIKPVPFSDPWKGRPYYDRPIKYWCHKQGSGTLSYEVKKE